MSKRELLAAPEVILTARLFMHERAEGCVGAVHGNAKETGGPKFGPPGLAVYFAAANCRRFLLRRWIR